VRDRGDIVVVAEDTDPAEPCDELCAGLLSDVDVTLGLAEQATRASRRMLRSSD